MKLAQIHEARYAGDHPIVKDIKATIKSGENDYRMNIDDRKKAKDVERGILDAFGSPDEQGPATDDEYRHMIWDMATLGKGADWGVQLQIIWAPMHKKIAVRPGQTAPTPPMRMEIFGTPIKIRS